MDTNIFFHITKKILETTKNENIIIILFELFLKIDYSLQKKYDYIKQTIQNIFANDKIKDDFIYLFSKIQKTYFGFSKLAFIFKYKKSKLLVENDLSMNFLNINNKTTICIYQNDNRYLFNIFDLANIINKNLSNAPMFFSVPLISKNPYNNIPFNKSTLYNIYFHLRNNLFVIPELFNKFFILNFNLKLFYTEYEYLIREHSINNHVNNSFIDILHKDTNNMIKEYNRTVRTIHQINIDEEFPKKKLVEIMRPYLKLYFLSKYSLIGIKKIKSRILLRNKLLILKKYNKSFGKKIVKLEYFLNKQGQRRVKNKIITFNDIHNSFNEKKYKNCFLQNHLSNSNVDEDVYVSEPHRERIDSSETNSNMSDNESDINNIPIIQNRLQNNYFNVVITTTQVFSNETLNLFNSNNDEEIQNETTNYDVEEETSDNESNEEDFDSVS
jgi:hypothetical protein